MDRPRLELVYAHSLLRFLSNELWGASGDSNEAASDGSNLKSVTRMLRFLLANFTVHHPATSDSTTPRRNESLKRQARAPGFKPSLRARSGRRAVMVIASSIKVFVLLLVGGSGASYEGLLVVAQSDEPAAAAAAAAASVRPAKG